MTYTFAYATNRIEGIITDWMKLGWVAVKLEPAFLGRMIEPHHWITFRKAHEMLNTIIIRDADLWTMVCRYQAVGKRCVKWTRLRPGLMTVEFEVDPNHREKERAAMGEGNKCEERAIVPVKKGDEVKLRRDRYPHRYIVMDTAANWAPGKLILAKKGGMFTDADYLCLCDPGDVEENLSTPKAQLGVLYYCADTGCYYKGKLNGRVHPIREGRLELTEYDYRVSMREVR